MRVLIALLVIVYLVGVGVALAPTIKANWSTGPASQFVESVATELPRALSWPATAYRSIAEKPSAPEKPRAPEERETRVRYSTFGRLRRPFWIEQEMYIAGMQCDRKSARDSSIPAV
jgi:hypothetical protein